MYFTLSFIYLKKMLSRIENHWKGSITFDGCQEPVFQRTTQASEKEQPVSYCSQYLHCVSEANQNYQPQNQQQKVGQWVGWFSQLWVSWILKDSQNLIGHQLRFHSLAGCLCYYWSGSFLVQEFLRILEKRGLGEFRTLDRKRKQLANSALRRSWLLVQSSSTNHYFWASNSRLAQLVVGIFG